MLHRPRFARHLLVRVAAPDRVEIRSERSRTILEGRLLPLVVPFIDGRRTVEEIIARLDDQASPVDVSFAMSMLADAGYVTEADDREWAGAAFIAALERDGDVDLQPHACAIVSYDPAIQVADIASLLQASGVTVADDSAFTIVVAASHHDARLAGCHDRALQDRRSWLLVKPTGSVLCVGPLFTPASPCWRCFDRRLRANADDAAADIPAMSIAPSRHVALSLAVLESVKWLATGASPLIAAMCTVDLATLETRLHPVRRRGTCRCTAEEPRSSRIELQPRPKSSTDDGGYRALSPDDGARMFNGLVSAVTGIVHAVDAVTTSGLIHTCTTELATDTEPLPPGATARPARAAGKGMSALQARASALGEAVERYSAIYRPGDVSETATYETMIRRGRPAVHPAGCLLVSARQYAARNEAGTSGLAQLAIPDPFDESLPVDWSEAWSLTFDRPCDVATAYAYFGYPFGESHRFCRADSNGCAAGTSLEDAILQGLFEVIERDALAIWWYNRVPRPAVDITAHSDYFVRLREHYESIGRTYWVLDITSDLGIPTFVSLSVPRGSTTMEGLLLGAGAHVDPVIALGRAVTEMNQFLPGWLAGDGRELFSASPDAGFLLPAAEPVRFPAYRGCDDLREDIRRLVALLAERDLETIVLNQTRAETGVPCVKVIVPGLRLCRPRFAAGRLFDVPVALGWRATPLAERDLNAVHMLM